MRYGSCFSGIEAASIAWELLGWSPAWFSEIDPFACAVLDYHWPKVKNYGDVRTIPNDARDVDIIIGGSPCQSFSVAGNRKGMDDPRGNLALEYVRLIERLRPRWFIWENVPGILSSGKGEDFKQVTNLVGECGYGWAYRVLNARYFGVPQSRRRVFLIGYLGDWRPPVAVLFERESMSRYSTKSRKKEEGVTRNTDENAAVRYNDERNGIVVHARSLNAHGRRGDAESETFVPIIKAYQQHGSDVGEMGTLRKGHGDVQSGVPFVPIVIQHAMIGRKLDAGPQGPGWRDDGLSFTLDSRSEADAVLAPVAPTTATTTDVSIIFQDSQYGVKSYDSAGTLRSGRIPEHQMVAHGLALRRLTPRETERLQGCPDDHTLVPYHGKPATDGRRYKVVGDSMPVPVIRWLGERVQAVDAILAQVQQGAITVPPIQNIAVPARSKPGPKSKPRFVDPNQLSFFEMET